MANEFDNYLQQVYQNSSQRNLTTLIKELKQLMRVAKIGGIQLSDDQKSMLSTWFMGASQVRADRSGTDLFDSRAVPVMLLQDVSRLLGLSDAKRTRRDFANDIMKYTKDVLGHAVDPVDDQEDVKDQAGEAGEAVAGEAKEESKFDDSTWIKMSDRIDKLSDDSLDGRTMSLFADALARVLATGVDPSQGGDKSFLSRALGATQLHLPGYNYCGPNTQLLKNILNKVRPINQLDRACMEHDIAYLEAGTIADPAMRAKEINLADNTLIEMSRDIANTNMNGSSPENLQLSSEATRVNGIMKIKRAVMPTDSFININAPALDPVLKQQLTKQLLEIADFAVQSAKDDGNDFSELVELIDEAIVANPVEYVDPQAPAAASAASAAAAPADPDAISRLHPVLPPEVVIDLVPPHQHVHNSNPQPPMPNTGAPPIVGERNMRPALYRSEGDQIELTAMEKKQNTLWLENFSWIDEGNGLGNQERLPWNLTGGKAKNSLFRAQQVNEVLRFSGDLYSGDQYRRSVSHLKMTTRRKYVIPMTPTSQRETLMIRDSSLPPGLGRKIHMFRETETTPLNWRNSANTRLIHPNIVDGIRV